MSDKHTTEEKSETTEKHKKPFNDTNLKVGLIAGAGIIALILWLCFGRGESSSLPMNDNTTPTKRSTERLGEVNFTLASTPVKVTTIEYYEGMRWRLKTSADCVVSTEPGNPSKTWNFPKGKHTVIPLNEGDLLYVWSKEDAGESASFFYEPKNN